MSQRFYFPRDQIFSDLGVIGIGYKLFTYETGTTTPLATYSDISLTSANPNPTIADSSGRFGDIFFNDAKLYKAVLKDSNDNTIWTADPVDPKTFTLADFDPQPTSFWGTTTGTSSLYILTANPAILSYSNTQFFIFTCHVDNADSPTIAISDLTSLNLKKYDSSGSKVNLRANDMRGDQRYLATNDGTDIIILNQLFQGTTSIIGSRYAPSPITIANNVTDPDHDIDFSAGVMEFDDGSGQAVATAMTKRLDDAWVAGSGNGGLFSGSIAADTWYHCFAIFNGTAVDAGFDTDVNAANIPSGYTVKERRGSVLTDVSGNIIGFTQLGNGFLWNDPFTDVPEGTIGTTSANLQPLSVPLGIKVLADVQITHSWNSGSGTFGLYTSLDQNDSAPSISNFHTTASSSSSFEGNYTNFIRTDTSSQIRTRFDSTNAAFTLVTNGWIDRLI